MPVDDVDDLEEYGVLKGDEFFGTNNRKELRN